MKQQQFQRVQHRSTTQTYRDSHVKVMSDVSNQDFKYLCAIIRKPQEGKTFICLENIRSNGQSYHLIVTMNTIKSNLQFFERAKSRFGDKICVFNSRGTKKDQESDFRHAKDISGVKKHLIGGATVVIMCAHPKRFDDSILDLLGEIEDSKTIRKSVIIHIDEAHAYVSAFRDKIVEMNRVSITERIYMYSATPFSIWSDESSVHETEQLFKNIYVVDNQREFNVMKSTDYFGVKDCDYRVVHRDYPMIDSVIPHEFVGRWGNDKQRGNVRAGLNISWGSPGVFDIGNEIDLLSHTKHTLKMLKDVRVKDEEFSYNFVPGFCRKLTHYMIMEMILDVYPRALVILINGDGTQLFRQDELGEVKDGLSVSPGFIGSPIPPMNEPSEQIESCIKKYPGRPTFITGFHCVGMSVTFINERIGNFDNVIYSHEHYMERPEVQYQLCRFLFNFTSWSPESRLKKKITRLFVSSRELVQNCLDYEVQIDKIDTELSGSMRSRSEVVGDVKVREKKVPKERRFDPLEPYAKIVGLKKVPVMDEEDVEDALDKVKKIYKDFTGKDLKGKAMPKKNDEGFYECSTTGERDVQIEPNKFRKTLDNWKKTSNFAMKKTKKRYARVYVAYYDKGDTNEYMWFVRMMELEDREEVDRFWESHEDRGK